MGYFIENSSSRNTSYPYLIAAKSFLKRVGRNLHKFLEMKLQFWLIMNKLQDYAVKFESGKLFDRVYFYRLTAGDYSSTKKLILLK